MKRSPNLEDNSIADPLLVSEDASLGKTQEKRQAPAVAAIAAEVEALVPGAAAADPAPNVEAIPEVKRESRGAIELSAKSKRIVFGTAMTANKIRR
jgi:hypothetical protein